MLIYRFSASEMLKFEKALKNPDLRKAIAKKQVSSTNDDLDLFYTVIKDRQHDISLVLSTLRDRARTVSSGKQIAAGLRKFSDFLVTDHKTFLREGVQERLNRKNNAFENAVIQVTAAPVAKLYMCSMYDVSIHEKPSDSSDSGFRLELRLYSQEGVQMLAASDWELKKGIKLNTKAATASV